MKLKMPIPNTLFRLGLLTMIVKVLLSFSSIIDISDSLDMILSVVASGFLVGSILQKYYPMKTLLLFAVIVLVGLVTSVRTGNMMIFITIITCLAMCGEDLEDAIRFMLFAESLFVVLTMLLSFGLHLSGTSMLTRVSGEARYNFGFSHPNVFSCVLTNLFAMYLWLHYDSVRSRNLLVICLMEIAAFLITGSRTGLVVTLFLVVFVVLYRNNKPHRFIKFMASYALPVLTAVFYGLCQAYQSGNALVLLVDQSLSGRIRLGAYALQRFGVSFFGQNLSGVEVKWDAFWKLSGITFDNIYTYLIATQFVWLVVVAFLFYIIAKKGSTKQHIFILTWALYGISEIHVMNPILFFVILIVTSLFDRNKRREMHAA